MTFLGFIRPVVHKLEISMNPLIVAPTLCCRIGEDRPTPVSSSCGSYLVISVDEDSPWSPLRRRTRRQLVRRSSAIRSVKGKRLSPQAAAVGTAVNAAVCPGVNQREPRESNSPHLRARCSANLTYDPKVDGVAMQLLKSGFFATKDVGDHRQHDTSPNRQGLVDGGRLTRHLRGHSAAKCGTIPTRRWGAPGDLDSMSEKGTVTQPIEDYAINDTETAALVGRRRLHRLALPSSLRLRKLFRQTAGREKDGFWQITRT